MLSRDALRCIVPVCSVGMVAVVCGAVIWTAGNGFSENAKMSILGVLCLRFSDNALIKDQSRIHQRFISAHVNVLVYCVYLR